MDVLKILLMQLIAMYITFVAGDMYIKGFRNSSIIETTKNYFYFILYVFTSPFILAFSIIKNLFIKHDSRGL